MAASNSVVERWALSLMVIGQQSEEALDLVDPRRGGRRVRHRPARAFCKPVTDQLDLIAGRAVHHDVDIEPCRNVLLDLVEEAAEPLGTMARHARADHVAGLDAERGE
jgi:hypothetical protein